MKLTLCVESLVSLENKTRLNVKYCNRAQLSLELGGCHILVLLGKLDVA